MILITVMATKRLRPSPGGPFFLAEWMDHLGVTDAALADHIDVSRSAISRWRSGARVPRRWTNENGTQDTILDIAEALSDLTGRKVAPADLWTLPKPKHVNNHRIRSRVKSP